MNPTWRAAALAALLCAVPLSAQTLTTARDVRSLSPEEADAGRDVQLRGVVVFVEGPSAVFVQDETSTAFFRTQQEPLPAVGDEIEVSSKTRMGLYLPGLDTATFRVLGHRRALPPGIPASFDDLVFSRFHYQRVAVEGIIRSIAPAGKKQTLVRLAMGSRVIEVRIERPPEEARPLVDCRVRVTGLAAGFINKPRRQLVQPYVRVLDWDEVEVLAAAPPLDAVPRVSAEELLAFRATGRGEQRVRIDGIVTAVLPHEQVFLRQDDLAFGVRLSQPTALEDGDRIEIAGFPEMDRFSAFVVDAVVTARTAGPPPEPRAVASLEKLDEALDGSLIAVTGVVRDAFKTEDGSALRLADKMRTLQARLPDGVEPPPVGATVQLTGIYLVESAAASSGFTTTPTVVSLRARSADDIAILKQPPWWTPRRLAAVLAALIGLTAVAGLWIAALRKQVNRQTAALRRRIEAEAALQERQRIAREFHDTLEQELAGVSLRLDALATRALDDKGRQLIAASRNLVSRIQTETRDLISDLRDPTETAGDLVSALAAVAARHSAESGADVRLEPVENLMALPPPIVHDLRMIAREAVTNSLKHGRASHVRLQLEQRDAALVLRVVDNGCGFDAAEATAVKHGHFGCAGIRERARKIGASVTWRSELQRGTTVEVALPFAPSFPKPAALASAAAVEPASSAARTANPQGAV